MGRSYLSSSTRDFSRDEVKCGPDLYRLHLGVYPAHDVLTLAKLKRVEKRRRRHKKPNMNEAHINWTKESPIGFPGEIAASEVPPPPQIPAKTHPFILSLYKHKAVIDEFRSNIAPSKIHEIGSREIEMVAPLGPGKFYGSSLPRPRIYTDVKYSHERVDPPISVVDPLLAWANEAHWSMGGLCTKRIRLQGRIEGNIGKLRAQNEKMVRISNMEKRGGSPVPEEKANQSDTVVDLADDDVVNRSVPTPAAPVAVKRKRRFMALEEEEEEAREEEEEVVVEKKKKPARKLINEFNSVATTPRRRSPRSAAVSGGGGGKDKSGDEGKSIGGSFVSKMKKASESLRSSRNRVD